MKYHMLSMSISILLRKDGSEADRKKEINVLAGNRIVTKSCIDNEKEHR